MHDIFIVDHGNINREFFAKYPHTKFLKYTSDRKQLYRNAALQAVTKHAWIVDSNCIYDNFDFDYEPPWHQADQIHVWPTLAQSHGGDTVLINTQEFLKKFDTFDEIQNYQAISWKTHTIFQHTQPAVFTWSRGIEKSSDPSRIRQIGSPLHMLKKTVNRAISPYIWIISDECDYSNFDFDWRPDWASEKFLHVWPTLNQHHGGDTYYVNVQEFKKQIDILEKLEHYQTIQWHEQCIPQKIKPEIFIWDKGNSQHLKQEYPDATVLRYIGSRLDMMRKTVRKATTPYIWVLSSNCKYTNFDFNWRPGWATEKHLHVWPTENQTKGGDTFYVNTIEFQKQCLEIEKIEQFNAITWHKQSIKQNINSDVVIWDNGKNQGNLEYLKNQFPTATVLRNVGSRFDMMQRTMRYANTSHMWIINSKCSYTNFDFNWRPGWATEKHLHVWPTENQTKGGDTFYVDVAEFQKQCLEIEKIENYNAVTWHKQSVSLTSTVDVIIWSFGNNQDNLASIIQAYPNAKILRYIGTHLEMLKKSVKYTDSEYFWILSDCCDYSNFTINWKPDWETEKSIHCWASGTQKFGDTFYVPRLEFLKESESLDRLEYYSSIIWHNVGYNRLAWPINYVDSADLYTTLKNHRFSSIYEYFVMPGSELGSTVDPSLWEDRKLIAYNRNGHVSLCPRDCVSQISNKVADYPYIVYHNCKNSTQKSQDIVFMSYDEKNADLNYEILKKQFPNVSRLHGVEGLVNAHKKAAEISTTPWVYIVFAKTEVDPSFKFDFNPNYLEIPSNYVFYSYNPVLNYSYGHDGIVLYHVKSVIDIKKWGVDFTMSFPTVTIPVISCRNNFNYSKYSAWRTAIREAYKLKKTNRINDKYHLHLWLTANHDKNGNWSICGAHDGLSLPDGIEENINDWHWLKSYFNEKYSKTIEET
jgi:hypothetical protein